MKASADNASAVRGTNSNIVCFSVNLQRKNANFIGLLLQNDML